MLLISKNFHKPSHTALLVPILVATEAKESYHLKLLLPHTMIILLLPITVNAGKILKEAIEKVLAFLRGKEYE